MIGNACASRFHLSSGLWPPGMPKQESFILVGRKLVLLFLTEGLKS